MAKAREEAARGGPWAKATAGPSLCTDAATQSADFQQQAASHAMNAALILRETAQALEGKFKGEPRMHESREALEALARGMGGVHFALGHAAHMSALAIHWRAVARQQEKGKT